MLALYLQRLDSPEDQSEFEKLYRTHRDLMYFIAYNVLHDHQRAEDAVSETFLRLAQCFSRVLEIGPVDSIPVKRYVAVSVKNLSLNMISHTKRHPETEFDDYKLPLITEESMNALLEQETLDTTLAALNELPEKYRAALQLYAVYGHDISEISKFLRISDGAVYKRIQRARKMLIDKLK